MASRYAAEPSDSELLATVINEPDRRPEAWASLVRRHGAKMYAVARSFNFDPATAEDLVQTAWLRLLERPNQVRDQSSIGPWLCTVVRNQARNVATRTRTVPTGFAFEWAPATEGDTCDGLIADERAAAMRYAFARLCDRCRQLLLLNVADPKLSYDEIAAATGMPRGSIGHNRRRCLDELRGHLPVGFES